MVMVITARERCDNEKNLNFITLVDALMSASKLIILIETVSKNPSLRKWLGLFVYIVLFLSKASFILSTESDKKYD